MNGNDLGGYYAKRLIVIFLSIILAALFVGAMLGMACSAFGQDVYDCRDGVCVLRAVTYSNPDPSYSWTIQSDDQVLLRKDGKIIGQWIPSERHYYPWDGKNNLPAVKPPIDPPGRFEAMGDDVKLWSKNGIRPDFIHSGDVPQLTYSGKTVHPGLIQAAFDGKMEDDSSKGYFVIVAKEEKARQGVLKDWNSLPKAFTNRWNVWMAPPSHFSMQDRFAGKPRFFTEGDPTVILQQADGTVLFRRPQAGQAYKTSDMQALLKSDPLYNPKDDPGGPEPKAPTPSFTLNTQTTTAAVLAVAGTVLLIFRRKK